MCVQIWHPTPSTAMLKTSISQSPIPYGLDRVQRRVDDPDVSPATLALGWVGVGDGGAGGGGAGLDAQVDHHVRVRVGDACGAQVLGGRGRSRAWWDALLAVVGLPRESAVIATRFKTSTWVMARSIPPQATNEVRERRGGCWAPPHGAIARGRGAHSRGTCTPNSCPPPSCRTCVRFDNCPRRCSCPRSSSLRSP